MRDKKNRTLMYIIDEQYRLLYVNPALSEAIPDIKLGGLCHKEINNLDTKCRSCPLNSDSFSNRAFFNKRLDSWFNTDSCETLYEGNLCNLIIHKCVPDNLNEVLSQSLGNQTFDVLAEYDLKDGTYNLIKSHKLLERYESGNIDDMANYVVSNYIDGFDYYRFKKFNSVSSIIDRIKRSEGRPIRDVFRLKRTIKSAEWVQIEILPYNMSDSLNLKVLATISFITPKGEDLEQQPVVLNPLTNLYVGTSFLVKAQEFIKAHSDRELCLASIDTDHFKIFNEWYGNTAGDIFLTALGRGLKGFDEEHQSLSGYLGNDNFAIVLYRDEDLIEKLQRLLCSISRSHGDGTGFLPAIGVYNIDKNDPEEISVSKMFDRATIAGSTIMDGSIERVRYYSSNMLNTREEEYKILHDAIQAIRNDEFVIYFQPKCVIETGKIFGAEALVRWPKEDRVVEPGEFIPILERTGSIVELDMYIWEKCIMWIKSLMDRGIKPVPISVNVSRIDLYYLDVSKIFKELVEKHNVPASYIELEITEGSYVERLDIIQKIVDDLREYGFKIALDDFGAGYSSLNVLKNINVDIMKMDIKFLDLKNDTQKGISILDSVINMMNSIDLTIICEGVETIEQVNILKKLGVKYVQGFYYYKPMPLQSMEKFLLRATNIDYELVDTNNSTSAISYYEFLGYLSHNDLLINNILGPIAFFSTDGVKLNILKVNESYTEITGLEVNSDIIYRDFLKNSLHYDDIAKLKNLFIEALKNPIDGSRATIRRYNEDDSLAYLDLKMFYITEKNGEKIFYSTVKDVTKKVLLDAEDKLNVIKLKETLRIESVNGFEYNASDRTLRLYNSTTTKKPKLITNNTIMNFPSSFVEQNIISQEEADRIELFFRSAIEHPMGNIITIDIPLRIEADLIWIRAQGKSVKSDSFVNTIVGSYRNITAEVVSGGNFVNEQLLEILKGASNLHALVNLTDDYVYQVNCQDSGLLELERKHYGYLYNLIIDNIVDRTEANRIAKEISLASLLRMFGNKKIMQSFDTKLMVGGNVSQKRLTIYMYSKDSKIYAYFFLISKENCLKNVKNNNGISADLACGIIRCNYNTNEIAMINDYALKIYGYDNIENFKADIVDGFPIREYEEDKPEIYRKRMSLNKEGDYEEIAYRIFVDGETRYLTGNISLIKQNNVLYLQRVFVDNTREKLEDLRVIEDEDRRIKSVIQSNNYTKSILMALNKEYLSSFTCDLTKNQYHAMTYHKTITEIINESKNYDEFMVNYAKKFVHKDDRYNFINMTSREYINKHISYENDSFSIRYRRLIDKEFKWFRLIIIATSFDNYGNTDNIVFAFRDINFDVKSKEIYEKKIEYYKDLFVSSSVDVYSGMVLIDLDTQKVSNIVFKDNEVKETAYDKNWETLYYETFNRVDSQYKNELERVFSLEALREKPDGYSVTIKYRINLGIGEDKYRFVSTTMRIIDYNSNKVATLFTIDITDDIKALESVKEKSQRDELTGLYNRKKLDEYKTLGFPALKSCGVLFMDINDLKITNDSLGHAAGDDLIKTAASSINAILNDRVHGYRYGGDEFLVIAENYTEAELQELISQWEDALIKCNSVTNIVCSMSLGYTYTDEAKSLDELILEADKEMYLYKQGVKLKEKQNSKDTSRLNTLLKYLDTDYVYIYEINVAEDRYRLLHVNDKASDSVLLRGISYTKAMEKSIIRTVALEDRERLYNILSLDNLKNVKEKTETIQYMSTYSNEPEAFVIKPIEFEGGICKRVAFAKKTNRRL